MEEPLPEPEPEPEPEPVMELRPPRPRMIVKFVWLLPTPDATLSPALPEAALSTLPVRTAVGLMTRTPEEPELVWLVVPSASTGDPAAATMATVPSTERKDRFTMTSQSKRGTKVARVV